MAFNAFLEMELAAKRAANKATSQAYISKLPRVANISGTTISPEELAQWGRDNASNAEPINLAQTVTRFGEQTPRQNAGVYKLAQPQPTTVFKGKLNNEVVNTNYFPSSVEAGRLEPGDRVGVYRDAYHDPDTGELITPAAIRYANVTGYANDSANKGMPIKFIRGKSTPFESLTSEQQAFALSKISPEDTRDVRTDALNQFFKPNAIGWGESPVPNQRGSLPFIKSNLKNPQYSDTTMAGIDKVLIGDEYRDIRWVNTGRDKQGVQPYIFDKDSTAKVHLSEVVSPQQYQDVMAGANAPQYMNEGTFKRFLRSSPNLNNYDEIKPTDATGKYQLVKGNTIADGESILPNQGEMWGIGQELNDTNKAQEQALLTRSIDSIPIYRGSNDEPGLDAIDAVARAGGSGTAIDDTVESFVNPFRSSNQTRSAAMSASDLARGSTWQSGKNQPSSGLPDLTQEDFMGNRMKYSPKGYPIDVSGTGYIPKGVANLLPASELLEPAAQWKFNGQDELLRFPTTPETPLVLANVNQYGVAEHPGNPDNAYNFLEKYPGRRIASLSVQRNNGTLDPTQLSSRGRWMGGGLQPQARYRSRDQTLYDPLEPSYLKIETPEGGSYLRLRSDTDPLTLESQAADKVARDVAAQYQEPPQVDPFTRQYSITQTGNEIPGVVPTGQIQGVTLPIMHEERIPGGTKSEPGFMPYTPSLAPSDLLDQHLADARIEIDGAKYPLTPEATSTEYLPSANQLSAERTQLHNRTRVGLDDNIQWWNQDSPSDAELTAIANDGELNFNPAEDIRNVRKSGTGLSSAYADPRIAPTDIVSAIEAKKQELNRTNALLTNYQTSPTANSPVYQDNNLTGSIIKYTNQAGLEQVVPANYFTKRKTVTDVDGTTHEEDVDYVNQKDLADIFDGTQRMNPRQLQARATHLQSEIGNATSAYSQLMGMEPAPEIQITTTTGKRRAANLAEQMEQAGLEVERHSALGTDVGAVRISDDGAMSATGSLPIGLPSERSVSLPVKYNSQEVIDPEVQAMVDQGKTDTAAAQRLIDFNEYHHQQQILSSVGRPQLREQIAVQPVEQPILRPKPLLVPASSEAALSQVLETPPADTAARRSFNGARVGTGRDARILYGQNKVNNGNDFISNASNVYPEYAPAVNINFQPTQSNFHDELFAPNVIDLHPTPTGLPEPQYVTADNFNTQRPTPNAQYQLPNWALPAAGGVYLAAAGMNEYQRQQEQKRQQDEAGLRRLYNG